MWARAPETRLERVRKKLFMQVKHSGAKEIPTSLRSAGAHSIHSGNRRAPVLTCSHSRVPISLDHANRPRVWAYCGRRRFRPMEPNHDLPKSIGYSDVNQGRSATPRSGIGSAAQSMPVTIRYPSASEPVSARAAGPADAIRRARQRRRSESGRSPVKRGLLDDEAQPPHRAPPGLRHLAAEPFR